MLSKAKHLLLFVDGGDKQILRCAQDDPCGTLYTNTRNGLIRPESGSQLLVSSVMTKRHG
ncbi:MAG: hypothetical protein HYX73_08515 [Acidobacteria bacterium]|nr:hypothetical protein [Acidobacteriota bacterium]